MTRVAIVGGGPAGLAAAFELTSNGRHAEYDVTLYQQGWRLGGKGASGPLVSAELYDPATNTIVSAGSSAVAHANGTATLLPDGKVLLVGGEGTDTPFTPVAELYDPATGVFTQT